MGGLVSQVAGWFNGLWQSIAEGVSGVPGAITGAFSYAFNVVRGMIDAFWNSLPGWLQGALKMAGNAVGGIAQGVQSMFGGALEKVSGDLQQAASALQNELQLTLDVGKGKHLALDGGEHSGVDVEDGEEDRGWFIRPFQRNFF